MRKLKHLLLALVLSLSLVLGACTSFVVIDSPGQEQNIENEKEDNPSQLEGEDSKDPSSPIEDDSDIQSNESGGQTISVNQGESYTSKEEVALYLHLYEELPPNYITKKEAQKLGWDSKEGNLGEVAPGKSIGGDYFGNREGILPEGKDYHECDIDSDGGYRNAKRIVYSEDGCIYYTEDHYESFELLYGEE